MPGPQTFRATIDLSTVATRGSVYLVSVSAEHRERAGVAAGDEVDVTLELR